jgi:hypothetical protein
MWEWTAVPSVPVTAKAMLPSTSAVTIELAHGVKMITFVNTVSTAAVCVTMPGAISASKHHVGNERQQAPRGQQAQVLLVRAWLSDSQS